MNISDLKSIHIFEGIDDKTLEKICKLDIDKAHLMPGDMVVCEGEEVNSLIVIKSGLLKQAKYLEDGSEKNSCILLRERSLSTASFIRRD